MSFVFNQFFDWIGNALCSQTRDDKFTPITADAVVAQLARKSGRATRERGKRAAIAGETSELVATARWKGALDALKKPEQKTPEEVDHILAVLRLHPIFGKMEETLLSEIAKTMRTSRVKRGDLVIRQGDAGDFYYVVAEGELDVFVGVPGEEPSASAKPVTTLRAGGSFGELALLYDAPRAASVRCRSGGAMLYGLGRIHFRNLVSERMMQNKSGLVAKLAAVPLLAGLEQRQLGLLADATEPLTFQDGDVIERMGQLADSLYVVLKGEVLCTRPDAMVVRLVPGNIFGESALQETAEPPTRQATCTAVGVVRCARLIAADCKEILGPLERAVEAAFMRKVLSSVELFSAFPTDRLAALAEKVTARSLSEGEAAITQGTLGDTFYIVKSGQVDVLAGGSGGWLPRNKVTTLRVGDYFGERSLLTREPSVASVVATAKTELLCISKTDFEALLGPLQALVDAVESRDKELGEGSSSTVGVRWVDLQIKMVLGEGSFGCVKLVVHTASKKTYALKGLHKGHLIKTNQVKNTINEKDIMRTCNHPFILECFATFNQPKHVHMLLGLAPGGELFTRMSKIGSCKPPDAALYIAMVACALGFLSERKIAHRDLKLENLLIDDVGYLKLVDFGFAKVVEERTWTFCGTPDYLAPEILTQKGHNYAVDWWTLGVLSYELLHGEPPFVEDDQMATFKRIAKLEYKFGRFCNGKARDLISRLLVEGPSKRLGMAGGSRDVTEHPFVNLTPQQMDGLLRKELKPPWVPRIADPLDTSNFDAVESSGGSQFDRYIDPKHEETWDREFGQHNGPQNRASVVG